MSRPKMAVYSSATGQRGYTLGPRPDPVQELLAVLGDLIEETLEPDASGPPEPPYEVSQATMTRLLDARARLRAAGTLYTRDDLEKALEGARTNTRDEVTLEVITKVVAFLRREAAAWRAPGSDRVDADELIEGLAEDLQDGEWQREPHRGGS